MDGREADKVDSDSVAGIFFVSIDGVSEERSVVGSGDDGNVDAINGCKSSGHVNHGDLMAWLSSMEERRS